MQTKKLEAARTNDVVAKQQKKAAVVDDRPSRLFEPSEDKAPTLECRVGFADDGARTLASGAKRRAFARGVVEAFSKAAAPSVAVEARGLDVAMASGKAQLVATVAATGDRAGLAETLEAWKGLLPFSVRSLAAAWVDAPDVAAPLSPQDRAAAYRAELGEAVVSRKAREAEGGGPGRRAREEGKGGWPGRMAREQSEGRG